MFNGAAAHAAVCCAPRIGRTNCFDCYPVRKTRLRAEIDEPQPIFRPVVEAENVQSQRHRVGDLFDGGNVAARWTVAAPAIKYTLDLLRRQSTRVLVGNVLCRPTSGLGKLCDARCDG